jgi:hypothetical protein
MDTANWYSKHDLLTQQHHGSQDGAILSAIIIRITPEKIIFSDRCYGEKFYLAQFCAQSIKYFTNLEHTLQFSTLFRGQNCACFRIAPSWTVQYRAENCANKITNSDFLCDVTSIRS